MAEPTPDSGVWVTISGAVGGILGALLGFLGPLVLAMFNKTDRRLESLLQGYEDRIKDLEAENVRLEKKAADLEKGKCRDE